MVSFLQKYISGLLNSIHVFNMNYSFVWVIDKLKGVLSKKLQNRMFLHKGSTCLLEFIDEENLPIEYGGKLEMENVRKDFMQKLEAKYKETTYLDEMKINLELYPKCIINFVANDKTIEEIIAEERKSKFDEFEEVRGSFKKLEID